MLESLFRKPYRRTGLFAMSVALWSAVAAASSSSMAMEVTTGKGMAGRAADMIGDGQGRIISTDWIDFKVSPFPDAFDRLPVMLQVGLQGSEEMTKNTICRLAPSIAGKKYCSLADTQYAMGPHFLAFYGGAQAELGTILSGEPSALQVFLGAGATRLESTNVEPIILPYSSIELVYRMEKRLNARAGLFLSLLNNADSLSIASPGLKLEYHF